MCVCHHSSGGNRWGWGDGVDLGDHSWDAGGDVARSQGHGCGGDWVDWSDWVCWCNIAAGGGGSSLRGAIDIGWVRWYNIGAGVGPGRAVGDLRTAGGDGVNDSRAGCAVVGGVGSNNGGHDGSGDD